MALTERQTKEDLLNGTKKGMVATPRIAWVLLLLVFSVLALGSWECGGGDGKQRPGSVRARLSIDGRRWDLRERDLDPGYNSGRSHLGCP